MRRRVVLNVATGHYIRYQRRLLDSLQKVGYTGPLKIWTDKFPAGSPPHAAVPYAFKLHAMAEAMAEDYQTILWCDSGVWFIKHPDPLFERIEQEGHFIVIGGDKLFNWSSDGALEFFGETRDSVQAKKWELIGGTVYGFDMTNSRTQSFWEAWIDCYHRGLFDGHYINSSSLIPEEVMAAKAGKPIGHVSSDPRCQGHRHDETIGSFLAYRLEMKLFPLGDLFQGYQRDDHTNAVARSGYTDETP